MNRQTEKKRGKKVKISIEDVISIARNIKDELVCSKALAEVTSELAKAGKPYEHVQKKPKESQKRQILRSLWGLS